MLAPDVTAFLTQQVAQHAGAGEGMFQVQFVHATHAREISVAHRPRQVIHAAPADAERPGLPGQG